MEWKNFIVLMCLSSRRNVFYKKIEKVINLTIFHTFQHICAFVKLSMKYITAILCYFIF